MCRQLVSKMWQNVANRQRRQMDVGVFEKKRKPQARGKRNYGRTQDQQ